MSNSEHFDDWQWVSLTIEKGLKLSRVTLLQMEKGGLAKGLHERRNSKEMKNLFAVAQQLTDGFRNLPVAAI